MTFGLGAFLFPTFRKGGRNINHKQKSRWLIPGDTKLKNRLYHMGITELSGEPEELSIAVLAGCLAGDFYSSVSSRPAVAQKISRELQRLVGQRRSDQAALYLLLQYRLAGLEIPDLLIWTMANREVSRRFLRHFLNQYRELAKGRAVL